MDIAADIRAMLASSDPGSGEPRVFTFGGVDVSCHPSFATEVDSLTSDAVTTGLTRVLRFARADAPTLGNGSSLTWNSQVWSVIGFSSAAQGQLVRAFLGKARS